MPRERSDMRRIREVLRLRDEFGASVRRIAAACRMPRTTVRDYLRRLESAELRFGDVREWSDAELERRLFRRRRCLHDRCRIGRRWSGTWAGGA